MRPGSRAGSQVGVGGTHLPTHVRPLHAPLASQEQLMSDRSQPQPTPPPGGATRLIVVVPVAGSVPVPVPVPVVGVGVGVGAGVGVTPPPVPPGTHCHSRHWTSQIWPIGQSELALQPVCGMLGTHTP
jgi:hypothetical protein